MGPQIPIAIKGQDGLSEMIPYIERFSQPGRWWFAFALFLSLLFLVGFTWIRPDFNREEIPDWRPVLARAEAALEKTNYTTQKVCIHKLPGWHPGGKIGEGYSWPPVV